MDDGGSSDDSAPPEAAPIARAAPVEKRGKHRPSELSSRRPVSRFRVAPGLSAGEGRGPKRRDPRFDEHGPPINEAGWRKSYDFLFEQQREEVAAMKAAVADSASASGKIRKRGSGKKRAALRAKLLGAEEDAALRLEAERMQSRVREDERRQLKRRVAEEARAEELAAVKEGKKPFYQKASALKARARPLPRAPFTSESPLSSLRVCPGHARVCRVSTCGVPRL